MGILAAINPGNGSGQSPGLGTRGAQVFSVPAARGAIALAVSDNGDSIGDAYVWNTATGKLVTTVSRMNGPPGVEAVRFSPDGKLLAVGDVTSGNILLWNAAENKIQATLTEQGGTGGYDLAFSPDGKAVAAVDGPDGHVRVLVWPSPAW